jgi:hypothetical protein
MTHQPNIGKGALADDGGAILVIGLFMSVLLVAFLYYLVGAGDSLLLRERMQDAADASAYSAAIVHARGMNVLAMLNILMAAVLAVLVVLKLISTICIAAIAICIGLAFWTAGASMAPVPALEAGREVADEAYSSLKEPVFTLLRGGNKLAHVVRDITPIVAFVEVEHMASGVYSPPAQLGVVFPLFTSLPTEDDDFSRLCKKAGEFAGHLAALPLSVILRWDWLANAFGSAIGGLAGAFSSYFCGDGGSSPPELSYEEPTDLPRLTSPESTRCDQERGKKPGEQNPSVLQGECQVAGDQAKAAAEAVDRTTGECVGPSRTLCQQRKASARTVCKPGATPDLKHWWWQERRMRRKYRLVEEQGKPARVVKVGDDVAVSSAYVGAKDGAGSPPCTYPSPPPLEEYEKWTAWNPDVQQPVCTKGPREPHPLYDLKNRGLVELDVEYLEVTDVIACQAVTTKTLKMEDRLGQGGGKDKSPQRVKACADLGEGPFQLKVGIKGDLDRLKRFEPGVALATWGRGASAEGTLQGWASELGQFSFAQAEYYFAGGGAPASKADYQKWKDDWLWTMGWKARLRRIHFDRDGSDCVTSKEIGDQLTPFQQAKQTLGELFLH